MTTAKQTYLVVGMTCEHCVRAVSEQLGALPGVHDVRVELNVGAPSPVVVVSDDALDRANVTTAIDEAGYTLLDEKS